MYIKKVKNMLKTQKNLKKQTNKEKGFKIININGLVLQK